MIGLLLPLRQLLDAAAVVTPAVVARGRAKALPLVVLGMADVVPFPADSADVLPLLVQGTVVVQPTTVRGVARALSLTTTGTASVIK